MLDQPPPIGGDEMLVSLVAVVICLGLSFLFAGSETAITSMGEHRVRKLLEQKIGPAAFFELWLRDHSTVLTVLLAGNTLVNILASSLVTSLTMGLERSKSLPSWLGDSIVTISIFILTLFVLVVGEIVPKTLAKTRPEWFLRPFWIIYGFHLMTRWLTGGLTWLSKALVSMLGVDANASGFLVTEEQIEDMVRIGSEEGSIDVSRGDLLRNVFDLWDTPIRAIMTPRTDMVGIPVEANAEQILEIVRENGYSRYPIFDGGPDHVIGLFYAKQLIEAEAEVRNGTFELRNHVREPIFVPESESTSHFCPTAEFECSSRRLGGWW
jgi:putative hemolysin